MSKQRYEILEELIKANNCKQVVEIGVSGGSTAMYLLEHCSIDRYIMVEPDPYKVFPLEYFKTFFPHSTYWLQMDSNKASMYYPDETFDLVFIDGDHSFSGTQLDIQCWFPKIKKNGILCGHDYCKEKRFDTEVSLVVNEVFKNINLEEDSIQKGLYIWWIRK